MVWYTILWFVHKFIRRGYGVILNLAIFKDNTCFMGYMRKIFLAGLLVPAFVFCGAKNGGESDYVYEEAELELVGMSYSIGDGDGAVQRTVTYYQNECPNETDEQLKITTDPIAPPLESYRFAPDGKSTVPASAFAPEQPCKLPRIINGSLLGSNGQINLYGTREYSEETVEYMFGTPDEILVTLPPGKITTLSAVAELYDITLTFTAEYKSSKSDKTVWVTGKFTGVQTGKINYKTSSRDI